uniref:Uncharacterized protein LOC105112494 isoform X3 n=1 Tax=Rhizophora mucronata TaxID=61149 RepID=A0A2P2NKN4_RHIMU
MHLNVRSVSRSIMENARKDSLFVKKCFLILCFVVKDAKRFTQDFSPLLGSAIILLTRIVGLSLSAFTKTKRSIRHNDLLLRRSATQN